MAHDDLAPNGWPVSKETSIPFGSLKGNETMVLAQAWAYSLSTSQARTISCIWRGNRSVAAVRSKL